MKRILTLFSFGVILLLSIVFYFRPDYNWDIMPYMALSMESTSPDFKAVHSDVYHIAKTELSTSKYNNLIDSSLTYKHITATNPAVFQNELAFYRTRPLYVQIIKFFHFTGIPLTKATLLPSILAFLLIGLLLYFWISETHPLNPLLLGIREGEAIKHTISLLFCLLIMVSPFMVSTARLSTPDMLVALFLLSGVWCLLEKRSVLIASVLFLLALLTRYDCILFIFLVLICFLIKERQKIFRWWPLVAGMILITIFQFRDILFILKHVFLIMPSSDRLTGSSGSNILTSYLNSFGNGFPSLFHSQVALISFIFLADIILRCRVLCTPWNDPTLLFSIFVYAYIPLRYIIHPSIDDRFLVVSYVVLLVFFLKTINSILTLKWSDHQ